MKFINALVVKLVDTKDLKTMGKNLEITEKLEKYINNFSLKLNPIQQEIIDTIIHLEMLRECK